MIPTEIIPDPRAGELYDGVGFPMWTVYDHPTDFPDDFVARLFDAMVNRPTRFVFVAKSRDVVFKALSPGFVWIERDPNDDPKILGVFV